jgi:enoyl-CoA hydratase/carnithine racemase
MREIVMNGPAKNALGTEMMEFLIARLAEAGKQPLLLTGAGDAFSAGLNLKELGSLEGEAMLRFLRVLETCITALWLHPAPTVAAVNGHAIAGGCVLALCCDRRVMTTSPKAKIGLNESVLGVRFPPRTLRVVSQRVPRRHHEEVLLAGVVVTPQEGLRLGLVDELADDPAAVARERLAALAALPALTYAMTKGDLRGRVPADLCPDADAERFLREMLPVWAGPEVKGRIAAVLKR